ncbi:MAG: hypothetical protein ACI4OA_06800 [Selenomonadaceae bacterium]
MSLKWDSFFEWNSWDNPMWQTGPLHQLANIRKIFILPITIVVGAIFALLPTALIGGAGFLLFGMLNKFDIAFTFVKIVYIAFTIIFTIYGMYVATRQIHHEDI